MKIIIGTGLQHLIKSFLLSSFLFSSFLLTNMAMAHVGDHHAMDFFHGFTHFMGEHYPLILGSAIIIVACWMLHKSRSSNK